MKFLVLFALFAVAAATTDYYTVKDDLDIDALIADPKESNALIDCLVNKGPCNEISQSYKDITEESLVHSCSRCSPKLKNQYWRFLQGVKKVYPNRYYEYRHYYDPENKYFDALEEELSKYA